MNTSKLFHTVVVLGMALAAEAACSSDTKPTPTADAGSSGGTSGSSGTSGTADGGPVADAATDAFAGWFCCG